MQVNILYAPSPDGDDASATYASRASEILGAEEHIDVSFVGPLAVNDEYSHDTGDSEGKDDADNNSLPWKFGSNNVATDRHLICLTIFLISCSADGSVDRSVRKIMRMLPKSSASKGKTTTASKSSSRYAIAALGQARCENSANQMGDTIFGTARRFDKAMAKSALFHTTAVAECERIETQVELAGPEQDFDPWIKTLIKTLQT